MCDSAGVMYWGDAYVGKIETAYLNGNGRRTLLTETIAIYIAFVLHDGNIYFTDWSYPYACLFSTASMLYAIGPMFVRASVRSPLTVSWAVMRRDSYVDFGAI